MSHPYLKFEKSDSMRGKYLPIFITFITLMILFLYPNNTLAKWAYKFVVFNDYTYVISDEYVTEIGREIGSVTKYSDVEGNYYGNFSNVYEKGTKYYSIKGISTKIAIAVEADGKYIKAIRKGEYAGSKYSPFNLIVGGIVFLILLGAFTFLVQKKVKRTKPY
ncbi:hypothetical protein RAH41_15580 [Gottfriedia acidiceleris]|uniref:hypothetical protein n=1 Tax=Gottfriedia acidiceleris TaxID=371036 RepID=UPI002F26A4BA